MLRIILPALILSAISLTSHAQLSWGENITAGSTTLKASHINEIRDAIEDLRTDVDGGAGADNLGNHSATQNLNLGRNDIVGIGFAEINVNDADTQLRFHDPSTGWYSMGMDFSDGSKFKINSGGTVGAANDFVITAGNIGIGTSNPSQRLDINGNVEATKFISTANSAGDSILEYEGGDRAMEQVSDRGAIQLSSADDAFYIGNGDVAKNINPTYFNPEAENIGIASDGNIYFYSDLQEGWGTQKTMVFDNSGRLGIGVSPSEELHVNGDALITGSLMIGAADTGFFRDQANRIATTDDFYVQSGSDNTYLYSTNTFLGAGSGDTTRLRGNNFVWNQGIIQGNGNVGIGTTSPQDKLHVSAGDIRLDSDFALQGEDSSGTARDLIQMRAGNYTAIGDTTNAQSVVVRSGNVGIGTSAPESALHVVRAGAGQPTAIFEQTGTSPNVALVDATNGMRLEYNSGADSLRVQSANTDGSYAGATVATFDRTGNVGIGTAGPSAKLEVAGDIKISDSAPTLRFVDTEDDDFMIHRNSGILYFMNDNNDNGTWDDGNDDRIVMRSQANGVYMGIGNTNPTTALQVAGTVTATNFVGNGSGLTGISGDNLGSHSATQDLYINNRALVSAGGSNFDFIKHDDASNTWNFGSDRPDMNTGTFGGGTVRAGSFVGNGSGLTGIAGDNMGNHTATTTLNMNDRYIDRVRAVRGIDWDDDTGGNDNKYRQFFRDGAHQFYDGGVAIGRYANGTFGDLANGRIMIQEQAGIGTTSLTGNLASGPALAIGDSDTGLKQMGDGQLGIFANNGERMRVSSNGNVGIGTASPSQRLDVAGSAEINGNITSNNIYALDNTLHKFISGGNSGSNGANILMYSGAHATTGVRADMNFRTNSSTRMHINGANGNIGIGTTSPSSKLDVNGEITLQNRLTMQPAAASYIEATRVGTTDMINVVANDNIQLSTGSNVARLRINGNGNVGIGTSSPAQKLDVQGNIQVAGDLRLDGSGYKALFMDGGSSTKTFGLHYGGDNTNEVRFGRYGDNFGGWESSAATIDLDAPNSTLFVKGNGNVGIGTSNPLAKLQVNGDVRFQGGNSNTIKFIDNDDDNFIIHQNSGVLYFMNDNNNNETWDDGNDDRIVMRGQANGMYMGIGTNSPSQELDVIGNIRATGQVRANSFCDQNGNNCASNPFLNPISVNGNEDVYGAFTGGAPTDTCNGDNTRPYVCGVSTNRNCVDRVSGTTSYSCGKDGVNTCTTTNNQRRDINCQHLQVYGNLTP